MDSINYLAVILSALSCFLVGGLWYSSLMFGNMWAKEAFGVSSLKDVKQGHPAHVFGASFIFAIVSAFGFGYLLGGPSRDFDLSITLGLIAGLCFVAPSFGINYRFAGRSWKLWLIDAAYHVVQFGLYGVIFGLLQ